MSDTHRGLWTVLEGVDGAGKSTAVTTVGLALAAKYPTTTFKVTKHPGATGLGQHIRQLVMFRGMEEHVLIDKMSEQLLMLVDHISFQNEVLLPSLNKGDVLISDRCNLLSGVVYGLANGLLFPDIDKIINIAHSPKIDRLYVLKCEWPIVQQRLDERKAQTGRDRFESRGPGFLRHVVDLYNELLTRPTGPLLALLNKIVPLENIKIIDASLSPAMVAEQIIADIEELLAWRQQFPGT